MSRNSLSRSDLHSFAANIYDNSRYMLRCAVASTRHIAPTYIVSWFHCRL